MEKLHTSGFRRRFQGTGSSFGTQAEGKAFRAGGFTLLEFLIATALLALLLVAVLQVTQLSLGSWSGADSRFKSFVLGRSVLESFSGEIENMVWGENIPHIGKASTPDSLQFFTRREGFGGGDLRPLTFVRYTSENGSLRRAEKACDWDDRGDFTTASLPAASAPADLCDGVLSFRFGFAGSDGTFVRNLPNPGDSPPRSVVLSFAVVDPRTYEWIEQQGLLASLQGQMDSLVVADEAKAVEAWVLWVENTPSLPPRLRANIQFFRRHYPLGEAAAFSP